jgi:GNAT superfamily N-acetyltransferase
VANTGRVTIASRENLPALAAASESDARGAQREAEHLAGTRCDVGRAAWLRASLDGVRIARDAHGGDDRETGAIGPTRCAMGGKVPEMFDVRAATLADRPEIIAMIREMIPGIDAEARWRWLYEGNPGGRALTWIAHAGDAVAGCTSFFPFRLWIDGEVVTAALGGDGYVRPAYRRHGLGSRLHDASRTAMASLGIGCMYGAPGAMNLTPLKHGGSREIGQVARWVRPVRAAAFGLRGPLLRRLRIGVPGADATLESMAPGDPRVDEVWALARRDLRLAAVRDAAFYGWRFVESPARRQVAFLILLQGRAIGVCALEPINGGDTLWIVDLITVPGEWHAALRAIVRHAAEHTHATTVDIKLFALDGRRRQMWRSGFTERDGKPFLVMIPRGGDRRFLDPDRWFYNGADSDLDSLG